MAQEGPLTPEKQLLRLIEKPEKGAGVETQKIKHHSLGLFSLRAWMGRFSFFKESIGKWFRGEGVCQFDVRAVNKILILSIFALLIYLISDVSLSLVNLEKGLDLDIEVKKSAEAARPPEASLLKAATFYLEQVRQKNIFEMGKAKKEDTEEAKTPSEESLHAAQNLRLVGISWSDDPDVMIEDTNVPRTYFVKRGEMIGDFKVQAIFKNKVILTREGEEIELK